MNARQDAFQVLEHAAVTDMTVGEARAAIVKKLFLEHYPAPKDILAFATNGFLSDADVLHDEATLRMSVWADRLEARGN